MAENSRALHALVIPYPTQGHITPMMQFAKKLASKGLTVTFVNTHYRHRQIIEAHSHRTDEVDSIHQNLGLDIRFAQISDGLPLDYDRSAKFYEFMRSVDNMGGELEKLILSLNQTGPPISCVIADTLLFWSLHVTQRFGIPWVSFWTQPTVIYAIYYHAHLLQAVRHSLYKEAAAGDQGKVLIDYIPGVPALEPRDLPSFFQDSDTDSQYVLDLLLTSAQTSHGADWVVCNSFDDLESAAGNASMYLQPPVLHVGPLLPSGYFNCENSEDTRVGTSIWAEYDCSAWLDSKPADSVIYVSFGSLIHVSKAQLEEIATGLRDSGQPFLWVLRPDIVASTVSDFLPDGFLDEIGSQGLVVSWCDQLRVLSHPSVAGFITHCGWNSMLEAIALGVPMLGFPFWSDQLTNCKLMADEWKIGFRLSKSTSDKLITREDVSSSIRKLFSEEGREKKTRNVQAFKDSARIAVREGGSSDKNIERFLECLKERNVELLENRVNEQVKNSE